jgi:hypothetical protein
LLEAEIARQEQLLDRPNRATQPGERVNDFYIARSIWCTDLLFSLFFPLFFSLDLEREQDAPLIKKKKRVLTHQKYKGKKIGRDINKFK